MASGSLHRLVGADDETPLSVTGAGTVTTDPVLLHSNSDNFAGVLQVDVNTGGTSLDVVVQTAPRKAGPWFDVITFTQVVGSDSDQLRNLDATVEHLLQYVRAEIVTVGGGSDYDVLLDLHYRPTSG